MFEENIILEGTRYLYIYVVPNNYIAAMQQY